MGYSGQPLQSLSGVILVPRHPGHRQSRGRAWVEWQRRPQVEGEALALDPYLYPEGRGTRARSVMAVVFTSNARLLRCSAPGLRHEGP
jgi:hypothetical protein